MKRLTSTICERRVKQKEKHLLAEIAAVSCIAPFPLAELCISQADLFDDNMIQTLTEATRAVCPLAADVFVSRFVQRQQLREGDEGRSLSGGTSGSGGGGQAGASYGAPKKLLNRALMTGKFLTMYEKSTRSVSPGSSPPLCSLCALVERSLRVGLRLLTLRSASRFKVAYRKYSFSRTYPSVTHSPWTLPWLAEGVL